MGRASAAGLHTEVFDYIVVGAGSGGCAVAARLSEDRDLRILLLEAGPRDRDPFLRLPAGYYRHNKGHLTWGYEIEAEAPTNQRRLSLPQARVLGGGSTINAMVYTRGAPEDFDLWAREGDCVGWSHREVEPFFIGTEGNETFSGTRHGSSGPLCVSDPVSPLPLTRAFLQACQDLGIPYNPDFNGGSLAGCGTFQRTIRNGRRCSAVTAFLQPAMNRGNLTVRTGCVVHKIVIEAGVAVGVLYGVGRDVVLVRAEREVVLSAGAIGSPKLLMLSGVGDPVHLDEVGIPVVHALNGVGQNVQEHANIDTVWELKGRHSYDRYKGSLMQAWAALEYVMFRSGPVTSNIIEAGAFWWSDRSEKIPDLQLHLLVGSGVNKGVDSIKGGDGVTLCAYPSRPQSRGTVRLRSSDPMDDPVINLNILGDFRDLNTQIDGLKLCMEIMQQKPLASFVRRLHRPNDHNMTNAALVEYVRANVRPGFHPVGSCKMGVGEDAVVDPQLRVHGIGRLRVADASIMPRIISTNTNATAIMIGERCAAFIQGNAHGL